MFTGIVEELGTLRGRTGGRLRFGAAVVLEDVHLGDSIAVNGCCLTVVASGDDWWEADVVDETFARTSLGGLSAGDPVNLERPVAVGGRLGGHIVQGHVDGVARVELPAPGLAVTVPTDLARYIVEKGSITVDGVSLTVAGVNGATVTIAVIPHTSAVTTLGVRRPGDHVNIEVDIVAKYLERLATPTIDATTRIDGSTTPEGTP